MIDTSALTDRNSETLNLLGTYCEVFWTSTNRMAKRQCEKCVYLVRGINHNMVCLELIYDAIEGMLKRENIYWVPIESVQYLKVLTPLQAQQRIDRLDREVFDSLPRD